MQGGLGQGLDQVLQKVALGLAPGERKGLKAQVLEAIRAGEGTVQVERTTPPGLEAQAFPDVYQQNIPAFTVYGVFWIVLVLAGLVLQEKRDGAFQRLWTAPVGRGVLLLGKLAPYYLVNLSPDRPDGCRPPGFLDGAPWASWW